MQRCKKLERPWKKSMAKTHGNQYIRVRSDDFYHTYRWTRLSRIFRANHPLCAECRRNGLYIPSEVVDHIVPWPVCEDFWDENNWQALCQGCNVTKGNRDKKLIKEYKMKCADNK